VLRHCAMVLGVLSLCLSMVAVVAQAGPLSIVGAPEYDAATGTGMKGGQLGGLPDGSHINSSGVAVASCNKYVSGTSLGQCAVRWDGTGTVATELGNLGSDANGVGNAGASAVNDAGTAVGSSYKYVGGSSQGYRAVRWDTGSTIAVELGALGSMSNGAAFASAADVNGIGTTVGASQKIVNGSNKGDRAVRWDAGSTLAVDLGCLGLDIQGNGSASAFLVNDAGVIAGVSAKYATGAFVGPRAVRWAPGSNIPIELGTLGTDSTGWGYANVYAMNKAGTIVGLADKVVNNNDLGFRAARWSIAGTAATELGNLGTSTSGTTTVEALGVNEIGTAVGIAEKYVNGNLKGMRAVRWDASGKAARELDNLGSDSSGVTNSYAYVVNDAGTTLGMATKYVSGSSTGNHAVIWRPDGTVIDLNDLGVAPKAGVGTWVLTSARSLSADGWAGGEGTFDPDGNGPLQSYSRMWVAQIGLGGTWTTASGGTWGRGPNWSTGTPATQVGNAVFKLASTYTVTLDRDELTGSVSVNAGTVTIATNSHTLSTENGLNIANGSTLSVTGTIVSNIANAGTLIPGNVLSTLNIHGNLTNAGRLEFEIADLSNYSRISVTDAFAAGGRIVVKLDGYVPLEGDRFNLMDFGSFTDSGCLFDFSQAGLPAGLRWDTTGFSANGSIDVIPEPSSFALLGVGAVSILGYLWRRRAFLRLQISRPA
jgi:hypothetical protein